MGFPWKYTAEVEYTRNPELKREDVKEIQEWIKSTGYLPSIDDQLVFHFLHACYYKIDQAKKAVDSFYSSRSKMTNFFDDMDPTLPDLQDAINKALMIAPLPLLETNGNAVMLLKFREESLDYFNYVHTGKWLLMSCFYNLWIQESKTSFITIIDATGFSMSHMMKGSLIDLRNFSNFGKNATPARVIKFVCININPAFKKLMTVVKPFLSKELVDSMVFHTDPAPFFEGQPKEAVPEDYGGSAPSVEKLHWEHMKILKEHREWITAEANLRIDETKKIGKTKNSVPKVGESLRTLELD